MKACGTAAAAVAADTTAYPADADRAADNGIARDVVVGSTLDSVGRSQMVHSDVHYTDPNCRHPKPRCDEPSQVSSMATVCSKCRRH